MRQPRRSMRASPRAWPRCCDPRPSTAIRRRRATTYGDVAGAWSRRRARRWPRPSAPPPPKSSGPRARPRRITWRSSASHSTTASAADTSSPRAPNTRRCSILAASCERRGWEVTYLVPDRDGVIDPEQVAAALRPDTVLVSLMHVNNEIGVVQNIAAVGAICERHGGAWLHVDAAQSVGKCPIDFASSGCRSHVPVGPQSVWAEGCGRAAGIATGRRAARTRAADGAAIRRRPGAFFAGGDPGDAASWSAWDWRCRSPSR